MIGGGLMFAPSTVAATAGVDPDQDGLASGLLNTARQIGGALGLAVLSSIAAISTNRPGRPPAQAATSGYGTAFTVGAAIFLATALIGAIALPHRLSRPGDDGPDTPATRNGCRSPIRPRRYDSIRELRSRTTTG
jgi:MFS family permease